MIKKLLFLLPFYCFLLLNACSSDSEGNLIGLPESSSSEPEMIISSSSINTAPEPIDYSKGVAMNKKLGYGINMGNTFDATCETCWGAGPAKKEQVETLVKLGFQSIRLPVRWDIETSKEPPYTISTTYLNRIREVLGWIQDAGMRAIINIHHHNSFINDTLPTGGPNTENKEMHLTRIDSIWAQIGRAYADFDNDFLVFEIFNEPVHGVTSDYYNEMISRTYPIIRESNPKRTLMYNTHPWGGYSGIKKIKLPKDGNIITSIHYYEPNGTYTHLGVSSNCSSANTRTWEGTRSEKENIVKHFNEMRNLADTYYPSLNPEGMPLNMGEFGATICGGQNARAKWTKAVVDEANSHDMSWHYWAYTSVGNFEVFNNRPTYTWYTYEGEYKSDGWDTLLLDALGIDSTLIQN